MGATYLYSSNECIENHWHSAAANRYYIRKLKFLYNRLNNRKFLTTERGRTQHTALSGKLNQSHGTHNKPLKIETSFSLSENRLAVNHAFLAFARATPTTAKTFGGAGAKASLYTRKRKRSITRKEP